MLRILHFVKNSALSFRNRLKTQGWRTTLIRLFGHGIPRLTGVPVAKYSQITPQIYVGAQVNKIGKQKLQLWGINGSVNMRIEYDDVANDLDFTHHCHLPTDDGQAPTLIQLQTGVAFIHQMVTTGNKVYIHCRSGVGRAPTMAVAYFVTQGYTLSEAVNLIEKARPFIQLTSPQIDQLNQFVEGQKTA